ncbi:type III PLP-dependent enzyme [Entomobacter blattae]|uniref:ornithine decarboxylase n=1 Tax=Entomobacter blattae TaxID=2762277 RepID=A0A7H1NQL2_9PROT|nr:type III PLP-dependent enzyme [Entomobacter blattae]QNT78072.1 Lysine/ornithine decarboxylase [Entomobacter blattae]
MNPKITRFLENQALPTPYLVVDVDHVEYRYQQLKTQLPQASIYYAVKANPAMAILERLVSLGSSFDAASWEEVELCLQAGAPAGGISFGNTIKKASAIAQAYQAGVRLFAFDCLEELEKIADQAPNAQVYCRLMVENKGAEWPLSRKFGTTLDNAKTLMLKAKDLGLDPYGLSFHVGSQQTSIHAYEAAIAKTALLFTDLAHAGIDLRMVNLGGGFPIRYQEEVPEIDQFTSTIAQAMTQYFKNNIPHIIIEPGRFLVGEAGTICSEVVLTSQRGIPDGPKWVYLDIGRFGGLAETEGEAIKYQIETPYPEGDMVSAAIAGPTCDGADIMYEKTPYQLPIQLKSGDRVSLHSTGAYVSSYCATKFNGFKPLAEYYI